MPTDKEIADLETVIYEKMNKNRQERSTLNKAMEALSSIKMQPREVEVTPAVKAVPATPAVTDPDDSTIILEPAVEEIRERRAVMKTVYDIMPDDPMIPNKKMKESRRKELFEGCKSILASLR